MVIPEVSRVEKPQAHLLFISISKTFCYICNLKTDYVEGLVIKNTGSWYIVRTDAGESIPCKIKGNFRLKGIRSTNPVSVGDRVDIEMNPDHTAFITRIHERKNYIIRRASNLSKESHILSLIHI